MSHGLVLSFLRRTPDSRDWTQQEIAEFYRVEAALLQAGLFVTTDRGISDEGEPWFVFCRADTEEVIAHFARIDEEYIVISSLHPGAVRGRNFRAIIQEMLESNQLMAPLRRHQGQKVYLHPATLLLAMIASAYMLSNDKDMLGGTAPSDNAKSSSVTSWLSQKFGILAAAAGLSVLWLDHQAESAFKSLESSLFGITLGDDKAHAVVAAAHNAAQLDATPQATVSAELTSHRADLSKQTESLLSPQDADGQGQGTSTAAGIKPGTVPAAAPNTDSNAGTTPDSSTSSSHVTLAHSDAIQGDSDNALSPGDFQPAFIPKGAVTTAVAIGPSEAPSQSASAELTPSSAGTVVPVNDAMQVAAAEISNELAPNELAPIVLSNGPVPLNLALQQAFQQVGFGTDTLHNLAEAPPAGLIDTSTSSPISSTASTASSGSAAASNGLTSSGGSAIADSSSSTASSSASSMSSTAGGVNPLVVQTVEAFLENTPAFEITVSGPNVVIIDTNVSDAKSVDFGVQTFDMSDGSTLSIVGILPTHAPGVA